MTIQYMDEPSEVDYGSLADICFDWLSAGCKRARRDFLVA